MHSWRLAIVLAGMVLYGCGEKTNQQDGNGPKTEVPEEGTNIQAYLSETGIDMGKLEAKVKGKLRAPFMYHYQRADSPYFEFPRTLHVDFYEDSVMVNERPTIESQLDALYGKYLPNQDKVYLRDSVVVKNILKGDTLHCKYLWWDQHTQRFSTDDSVRINTRDKILFGTGMEADQNFRWYTIRHMTGIVLTSGNNIPK
ncbi:MAG TPA: LPS export ABC transporter periplasmic protein LptC [Puia sp.]|nr:LPS export ABC transporter periplasmic protein LptC [Puia sp.]